MASNPLSAQWINEIHYDNNGGDVDECIEIAGPAGTNLTGWQIILYNGSGGVVYDTDNFTAGLLIPDEGCGYGTVSICYPANGIQNGAPDGIVLYDGSSVIQFLSYEGSFTATNGPAVGLTSVDIGVSEAGTTPVGESLQLTGTGTTYGDFTWQSPSASSQGSLNAGQIISPCGSSNSITASNLSSTSFSVDCTTSATGTIDLLSTGTFNAGNDYDIQLSDASGSFAAPLIIGTITSTNNSENNIPISIPGGTASSSGYSIRIVSNNPSVISNILSPITITLTGGPCVFIPPHMTSVIINSCNTAPCGEGQNEMVFGNTGDYSILVNEANFNFSYTNTPPILENYTDNLTNNAANTLLINDECPSTDPFIDAFGTTIPPNSSWLLVNDQICPDIALDWIGLCNSGPIYIIYSTDPTWSPTGNFSNTTNDIRPYQTSITTTSGDTFTIDYETDGSLYPDNDGVFATFDSDGGPATSYGDDDCSFNVSVLPIELNSFTGSYNGKSTDLTWETISEQNNDYFRLYHSSNGKVFEEIGTVPGSGTTSSLLNYSFEHRAPTPGINYYKLKSVDYDGTVHDKGIIAVQVEMNHIFYDQITQSIQMNYKSDYAVYGSDGRLITRVEHQNAIPFSGFGIFHVIDERTGEAFKLGVW